jgi:hypothetical protein
MYGARILKTASEGQTLFVARVPSHKGSNHKVGVEEKIPRRGF